MILAVMAGCSSGGDTATSPTTPATVAATSEATTASTTTVATALDNPRGSAMNGAIVFGQKGDIYSFDPATGETTVVVGGPTNDVAPGFSPDGTRIVFLRTDDASSYISAPDGSGLARWADASRLAAWSWSPDGSRIAAIPDGGSAHDLTIWDGGAGPLTTVDVDAPANAPPQWIDDDTLLLIEEVKDSVALHYWTVNVDGTSLTPVSAVHPCCETSVDPATKRAAYSDFEPGTEGSSVHLLDLTTGLDSILPQTALDYVHPEQKYNSVPWNYFSPRFSPDGKWIVAIGGPTNRPVLLATDGTGGAMTLGPLPQNNDPQTITFSPDSTRVLITRSDGVYLFSIPDGAGGLIDWPMKWEAANDENPPSWQRVPG